MKKTYPFSLIIALFVLFACKEEKKIPRIAIAGLAIESSTFSPAQTHEEAFHARMGDTILSSYDFLAPDSILFKKAEWIPVLIGRSLPGGIVTREAYESLMGKMLEGLKKNLPYDGIFFDIHGAMSVVGLDDPEGDMIERIRQVVGYETIISTSMDLHGNVSWRLAHNSDLITCFRMAPHEDAVERAGVEANHADGHVLDGVGLVIPLRPHRRDFRGLVAH